MKTNAVILIAIIVGGVFGVMGSSLYWMANPELVTTVSTQTQQNYVTVTGTMTTNYVYSSSITISLGNPSLMNGLQTPNLPTCIAPYGNGNPSGNWKCNPALNMTALAPYLPLVQVSGTLYPANSACGVSMRIAQPNDEGIIYTFVDVVNVPPSWSGAITLLGYWESGGNCNFRIFVAVGTVA